MFLSTNRVDQVINTVVLSQGKSSGVTKSFIATNIKRTYFQLTGVQMSEEQAHFIDNQLGNQRAFVLYKHLVNLF